MSELPPEMAYVSGLAAMRGEADAKERNGLLARIAELEARTEQECIDDTFTAIRMKLDKAEDDARGWADSFKQAEAELAAMTEKYDVMLTLHNDEMHAAERLRAELAALKAQRCETCGNEAANGNHALCVGTVRLCNRWKKP